MRGRGGDVTLFEGASSPSAIRNAVRAAGRSTSSLDVASSIFSASTEAGTIGHYCGAARVCGEIFQFLVGGFKVIQATEQQQLQR